MTAHDIYKTGNHMTVYSSPKHNVFIPQQFQIRQKTTFQFWLAFIDTLSENLICYDDACGKSKYWEEL